MLGKLLKYELKSVSRLFGAIYLVILALAVVIGVLVRPNWQSTSAETALLIVTMIYVVLVIVLAILTLVLIVQRFYKNLLQGEGYLMHTLPVPTWMLVACKTISAFIWELLAAVVVCVSFFLMALCGGIWGDAMGGFRVLLNDTVFIGYVNEITPLVILALAVSIFAMVRWILTFYLSMSVGGAVKRHKKGCSVLVFLVVIIASSIVSAIIDVRCLYSGSDMYASETIEAWQRVAGGELILNLAFAAVFFALTTWFLSKKLNLE